MESNERGDSRDYPKWRASLTRGLEGELPPESASISRQARGGLGFCSSGVGRCVSKPKSAGISSRAFSGDREVDGEQSLEFSLEDVSSAISPAGCTNEMVALPQSLAKDINTERLLKAEVA